ncbi:MAG: methyltransferase [Planctomycetota bacterium]
MTRPAGPVSDPTSIFRYRDGLSAVDLLITAITHLDLFSVLSEESLTLSEICERLDLDARATDVMLTLLVAMDYLERLPGGKVGATLVAKEFLRSESPWSLIPYYASAKGRPGCEAMLETLRTGRTASWTAQDDEWSVKMEDEAFARSFTGEMNCRGNYLGPKVAEAVDLSARRHVLDIGGGSGIYAICMAAAYPGLRAAVYEKPPVDAIARREMEARGLSDRVDTIAGDMFESIPEGSDVHLYSNVLHDWSESDCLDLLARSRETIADGGLVVVHDAFIDREKAGPIHVAEYSVVLMHFTQGKCYSVGEMEKMLLDTGFHDVEHRDVAVGRGVVTARA